MKLKLAFVFIFLSLILLSGCISPSPAPNTPLATIEQGNIPTSSIVLTVTPSFTFSPEQATANAHQTQFNESAATQAYIWTTAIPATLEARGVECRDGFYLELPLDVIGYSNDRWSLFTCSPSYPQIDANWTPGVIDYGARYTQIIKSDFSKTWIIQHNMFDYSTINRRDALMVPYLWTTDGAYLYLYPTYYPGGSGYSQSAFLYAHINDLYRINLETGKFELFLKRNQITDMDFSPNDQLLAYSEQDSPNLIHIKNMKNDEDVQIEIYENIVAAGAFIWKPDSTKVVFFVGYGKESENWQDDLSGTSIFVLTPQNMHLQKVLEKDTRKFAPGRCPNDEYWLDDNTICLYSVDPELSYWDNRFTFNIKTGKFEPIPYP